MIVMVKLMSESLIPIISIRMQTGMEVTPLSKDVFLILDM